MTEALHGRIQHQRPQITQTNSVRCPALSNAGFTLAQLRAAVAAADAAFEAIEALGLPDDTPLNFRPALDGGEIFWTANG